MEMKGVDEWVILRFDRKNGDKVRDGTDKNDDDDDDGDENENDV